MKKTIQKSLALLLAAVMLFAASPIIGLDFSLPASAASESDLTFKLINGGKEYEVSACNEAAEGELIIPAIHEGKPVTSIGEEAFSECTNLASIAIPNSVTSIGDYAFSECTNLAEMNVAENNANYFSADGALFNKDKTELICYPIGKSATSYEIPSTVKSIGNFAFAYCQNLESITIPNSVTSIGNSAFVSCTNLASITIPNSVTSINTSTFYNCQALASITIPDSVTSIGNYAFFGTAYYNKSANWTGGVLYIDGCLIRANNSYTSCNITEGTRLIANSAFQSCTNITSVTIPNSVTSIGSYAFSECTNLASITFAEGSELESIGNYAFNSCTNLASITIPNSVTNIGKWAFLGTKVDENLPDGLTYLGKVAYKYKGTMLANTELTLKADTTQICFRAFENCTGITSVTIPDSVKSIGDSAFYKGTSLESITIPNSVTSIGNSAFSECTSLASITIPNSVTSIGYEAFCGCNSLAEMNVAENNANYSSVDGILFNKDKTELICFPIGKSATSYEIPSTVKSICNFAFESCENLESVIIPDSVTSIDDSAFESCDSLTSITIPNSVMSIGYFAFYECTNLASVTFAEGSKLESIGYSAFKYCESLTSFTIPNSVTSIVDEAFNNCDSLASITIPSSVTRIGRTAFYGCAALSDVYYGGDESDRGKLVISANNAPLLNAAWHYSVRVTGVALGITSKTLAVGATQQLTATVAPDNATNKDVVWSSSDEEIAAVSATGLVTAISAGTATITVTTADGNKTAACAITVANPTVSINNNPGTKTINYGDELKLTATVTNRPEGAVIVWYVNGAEKGRGAEYTAPAGTADYTVTVKIVDKDGNIIKDAEDNEITDEEDVTVKAGFFQKLINFFKNLFGASRVVVQAFKEF